MVLITHERAMDTPRPNMSSAVKHSEGYIDKEGGLPRYILTLKNWIFGLLTG